MNIMNDRWASRNPNNVTHSTRTHAKHIVSLANTQWRKLFSIRPIQIRTLKIGVRPASTTYQDDYPRALLHLWKGTNIVASASLFLRRSFYMLAVANQGYNVFLVHGSSTFHQYTHIWRLMRTHDQDIVFFFFCGRVLQKDSTRVYFHFE